MKKRSLRSGLLLIGLMVITLTTGGCSSESGLVLAGIVETNIYAHYSEVSGKIVQEPVEIGQTVKAGEILAVIDDSGERKALEQLEQTLVKKQATLAELTAKTDPEAVKQAVNNVALAEIANANAQLSLEKTKQDYDNAQALLEAGALAQAELDKLKYQFDIAEAAVTTTALQLDNARQQLALIQKGTPQEKIASAQADIALTEIQIRQTKDNLAKYTVTALQDGKVISRNYLLGNIVSPGFNLVDIASETEKHLVAYVPKDHLSEISYGQQVVIRSGEQEFQGTISFIDVKAQYTPKDMQSAANNNKESIKIKVSLVDGTPLKVGQKAEIVISE